MAHPRSTHDIVVEGNIGALLERARSAPLSTTLLVVRHVIVGMLRSQGHDDAALAVIQAMDTGARTLVQATLRAEVRRLGLSLKSHHALLSAAAALDDAERGLDVANDHGALEMAIRRALAGGASRAQLEDARRACESDSRASDA